MVRVLHNISAAFDSSRFSHTDGADLNSRRRTTAAPNNRLTGTSPAPHPAKN